MAIVEVVGVVGAALAEAGISVSLHAIGNAVGSAGKKMFVYVKKKALDKETISDLYTTLVGEHLCAFYKSEKHVLISIDGNEYLVPGSFAIKPVASGALSDQTIQFNVEKTKYKLPESILPYAKPVLAKAKIDTRLFDGEVVRLASLSKNATGSEIATLQLASYYDAIATNFSMDNRPSSQPQTLRQYLHGASSSLSNFETSPLVNHIGVVLMIETADGMLSAQVRSDNVANRPNTISASASGTLDWRDIASLPGPINIEAIAQGSLREAQRELGIAPISVAFLGALRDYERGGMPDFYFYARIDAALATISARHKDAEEAAESKSITGFELHSEQLIHDNEHSRINFHKRVHLILDKTADSANLTFYAGTLLAANHILKNPL